jgi:MinD-like ATPase involved in chromosome partitioning or flagellar assembly
MSGPLIAFTGSTPNIGTTVAALGTAFRLASRTGKRMGFLCLNLKSAKTHLYLGVDEPKVTLDAIRPELRAGTLTADKLRAYAQVPPRLRGVHVLFGNLPRDQAEYYEPGQIEHLLRTAREAFDAVVADTGAYWDNAATICAVRMAEHRLLVTTGQFTNFREDVYRWIGQIAPQFGVRPGEFHLVVLRRSDRMSEGFGLKEILRETGSSGVSELKADESLGVHLDSGRLDEWLADERRAAAFDVVAEPLMRKLGWTDGERRIDRHRMPRPWWLRAPTDKRGGKT